MTKFEQVTTALEAPPASRREEIGRIIETLSYGDLHPECALSDEQLADLAARVANPGPVASEAEVDAFFARFQP